MRHTFSLAMMLSSLLTASALAGDGNVPQSTLNVLGLAGMEIVSDEEGMQVRGMSGAAATMGHSLVSGVLIDPGTNSYVFGVDANTASASLETTSFLPVTGPSHATLSTVNLSLSVTSPLGAFSGVLIGGAGGSGSASPH